MQRGDQIQYFLIYLFTYYTTHTSVLIIIIIIIIIVIIIIRMFNVASVTELLRDPQMLREAQLKPDQSQKGDMKKTCL